MSTKVTRKQTGFTIVELLITIVVIGILAAISIVAYNGIQDRAKQAKIKNDLAQLIQAGTAAHVLTGQTMAQITGLGSGGSGTTADECGRKTTGVDIAALPKTDDCWVEYYEALENLGEASGVNFGDFVDPWGRPYVIYEKEGVDPLDGEACERDYFGTFKYPHEQWGLENIAELNYVSARCR